MKIIIDLPEARYKDIQRIASVQLESHYFKTAEQIIAEGVALETKTQYQIIHQIEALYAKATALGYIQKPLAWALYQVWQEVDKSESEDEE